MSATYRTVRCSHCRLSGHNKRTCPSKHVTMRSDDRKKEVIKRKTMSDKKKKAVEKKTTIDLCPICLDDCSGKTCALECGHTFHTKCIFNWLSKNKSCPCCRAEIKELCVPREIKLPSLGIVGALYRLGIETVGDRFIQGTDVDIIEHWYLLFKFRMETLTPDEYDDIINI